MFGFGTGSFRLDTSLFRLGSKDTRSFRLVTSVQDHVQRSFRFDTRLFKPGTRSFRLDTRSFRLGIQDRLD